MIHPDISGQSDDGCLFRGNPEKFLGPALVAYIDILGLSHALQTDWGGHPTSALHRLLRIKNTMPRDDEKTQITVADYDAGSDKDIAKHHIARLKELRAKAGKAKIKYDELIRILETPKAEVPHPSLEDMAGA